MSIGRTVREFFHSDKAGGLVLIACTIASLALANLPWRVAYQNIFTIELAGLSVNGWINDGFMAVFFFVIGLELKRELFVGKLSNLKTASLGLFAAGGGMAVPAIIYWLMTHGTPVQSGVGIPIATDIVFAIGVLSLLGSRVPSSLTVLLTALAVFDDLGAIIVIALFYTASLSWMYLAAAAIVYAVLIVLHRLDLTSTIPYLIGGVLLWYCMLHSGVHPTVAGVLLAFVIPFKQERTVSLSHMLEFVLKRPVTFGILPLFTLANTAITFGPGAAAGLLSPGSLGIIGGLWIGKPVGIVLVAMAAVKLGLSRLPESLSLRHIMGMGMLGGIGFTMSIFITSLAFSNPEQTTQAVTAILVASILSGATGYWWLRLGTASRADSI